MISVSWGFGGQLGGGGPWYGGSGGLSSGAEVNSRVGVRVYGSSCVAFLWGCEMICLSGGSATKLEGSVRNRCLRCHLQ